MTSGPAEDGFPYAARPETPFVLPMMETPAARQVSKTPATDGRIWTELEAHAVLEKLTEIDVQQQVFRAQMFLQLRVRGGAQRSELVKNDFENTKKWFLNRFDFTNCQHAYDAASLSKG